MIAYSELEGRPFFFKLIQKRQGLNNYLTKHFTISEPQNQEIGELYVVQKRRSTAFEAPKL